MYAKAGPFSLALAMLVRDQVLSLPSELKERSHEQEPTERVNRSCKICLDRIQYIAMAHCLLRALDLLSIAVAVLHLPTQ